MKKIIFGPEIAAKAWAIGEQTVPKGFTLELLSKSPDQRIEQLESADFYLGFRSGIQDRDYDHMRNIKLIQFLSAGYDGMNLPKLRELGIPCDSLESRFEIKRVVETVKGRPEEHAVNYAVLRGMQKVCSSIQPREFVRYCFLSFLNASRDPRGSFIFLGLPWGLG